MRWLVACAHLGSEWWMLGRFLEFDPECDSVDIKDVADILDAPDDYQKLVQDTFFGNPYNWIDQNDLPVRTSRDQDERQDYYLPLNSTIQEQASVAYIQAFEALNVTDFELTTSFYRASATVDSYVGIRFRVNSDRNSYYELRLMQNCQMRLYQRFDNGTNTLIFEDSGVLIGDENLATNCSDSLEDYLSMRLEDNILSVTLNDIRFSPINLPSDTLAQFTQGGVELVSYQTNAKFYFISLTGRE